MKKIIVLFCIILSYNSIYSQSESTQRPNYIYIKTFLEDKRMFVFEYQDTLGNIIIPQGKYSQLSKADKYGFIKVRKNSSGSKTIENNVGYIDINENILIPFDYSGLSRFELNLACAEKNEKIGYINRKGETVIPFKYDSYRKFFKQGVIVNQIRNKDILIDTLGNEILSYNHPYQRIKENFPFDDFLWIQQDEKWAFFNIKAEPLTPFIFDKMHPAEILDVHLSYGKSSQWFYKGINVVEKDNQFAILNNKMEYVVPWDTYKWISSMNAGGIMIVKHNNKYGLINHLLETVQQIEFDTISNKSARSYGKSYPSYWAKKGTKYYIFDSIGNWIDSTEYDNIKLLENNLYLVTKGEKSWRLDENGIKINDDFIFIREDANGFVAEKNSKYGLIDDYDEVIIPFEYENIISERAGNIFVKNNGKWGVVDEDNEQLVECKYDYITYAYDDNNEERNYVVVQNDKFGKVTETGDEIFPCKYDGITTWVEYGPKGHYVRIGDKIGLIDYSGKIVIPIKYEAVYCSYGTMWAKVYNNGKMGLCNKKNGEIFLPLEYDSIYIDHSIFYDDNKPTKIVTYKNNIINILNDKGNIIHSNVSEKDLKEKHKISSSQYYDMPCFYSFVLMKHNRTFKPPTCLINFLKSYDESIETIYYKMIDD